MRNKNRSPFLHYILFLFVLCIMAIFMLDNIADFIIGFFAGFKEMDSEHSRELYGGISLVLGIVIICAVGQIFFLGIARKVGEPIKNLSEGMQEVSRGNLAVRIPVKGSFEFAQMEEAFNYMTERLEEETKFRLLQEQKNQQLYAGIAHDLKTPMTMVMGYAKLLEYEEAISSEDRKRYLSTITEQTAHMNELLDSLLMFAKLGNQSYELKREQKDIAECLRTCAANCYPAMEEAGTLIELFVPNYTVIFDFDELAIKRVFTNLLVNVIRHNPKGTACTISLDEDTISSYSGKTIRIVIADNGPKIPDELKDALFDSFIVGDSSRNTKNGSGLGLSISKKIVERHGGQLYYVDEWNDSFKAFVIELSNAVHLAEK